MHILKFGLAVCIFLGCAITTVCANDIGGEALFQPELPDWILPSPPIEALVSPDDQCDNSAHLPPIRSQYPLGSCVAFAWGYYYKTYQEWEEHGWDVNDSTHQFSPSFIYNQINGGVDDGSYGSDANKILIDHGCATWVDMPYDSGSFTSMPDEEAYYNGISYRCDQAFSINLFTEGLLPVKNHLLNGHVAVTYIWCYENFQHVNLYNNIYCLSQISGPIVWGHAITLCGFDDNMVTADGVGAFKIANSYGIDWGDNGYCWISYEAMLSSIISQGSVGYTTDLIDYSPSIMARFHVEHEDRLAIGYRFSFGEQPILPEWFKSFFNFTMIPQAIIPYPETNIVVDLTEGEECFYYPTTTTTMWMRCTDHNANNGYEGTVTYFSAEELNLPVEVISTDPPVTIPDSYTDAYLSLTFDALGDIDDSEYFTPSSLQLNDPYPNPFNPTTMLNYTLPAAQKVELKVYNIAGAMVMTLIDGYRDAGSHMITFDAENLPSGVYFARMSTGEFEQTQKLLLIK